MKDEGGRMKEEFLSFFFIPHPSSFILSKSLVTVFAGTHIRLGLLLARQGAPSAVEYTREGVAIAEKLSAANAENSELRGFLAFSYASLGDVHATEAGKRAGEWQEARGWYQRALDIMTDLKSRGAWTSPDFGSVENLKGKLTECDAMLAKLQ
jgi:hypothetical protein